MRLPNLKELAILSLAMTSQEVQAPDVDFISSEVSEEVQKVVDDKELATRSEADIVFEKAEKESDYFLEHFEELVEFDVDKTRQILANYFGWHGLVDIFSLGDNLQLLGVEFIEGLLVIELEKNNIGIFVEGINRLSFLDKEFVENGILELKKKVTEMSQDKEEQRKIFGILDVLKEIDSIWLEKIIRGIVDEHPELSIMYADIIFSFNQNLAQELATTSVQKAPIFALAYYKRHNKKLGIDLFQPVFDKKKLEISAMENPSIAWIGINELIDIDQKWAKNLLDKIAKKEPRGALFFIKPLVLIDKEWARGLIALAVEQHPEDVFRNIDDLMVFGSDFVKELVRVVSKKKPQDIMYNLGKLVSIDEEWSKTVISTAVEELDSFFHVFFHLHELVAIDKALAINIVNKIIENEPSYLFSNIHKLLEIDREWVKILISENSKNTDLISNIDKLLEIDKEWTKKIIGDVLENDIADVFFYIEKLSLVADRDWLKGLLEKAAYANPHFLFYSIQKVADFDKGLASSLIVRFAKKSPVAAIGSIKNMFFMDLSTMKKVLSHALSLQNIEYILEHEDPSKISPSLKKMTNPELNHAILQLIQNISVDDYNFFEDLNFHNLDDDRYRDLLVYISDYSDDIHTRMRILNYVYQQDFPIGKAKEAIDNAQLLEAHVRVRGQAPTAAFEILQNYDIDDFWQYFGKDYRNSDAKIGDVNPRDFENTWLESPARWWESVWEDGEELRVLDIRNVAAYEALFMFLKKTNTTYLEEKIFKSIDFSKFKEFVKNTSIAQMLTVIRVFSNTVHPAFKDILISHLDYQEEDLCSPFVQYKNSDTGNIDVTQNNISELNAYLDLFIFLQNTDKVNLAHIVKTVFPDFNASTNQEAIQFLLNHLDVEEIAFSEVQSPDQLAGVIVLQNLVRDFEISSANTYLSNKFPGIDVSGIFTKNNLVDLDFVLDLKAVESLRVKINAITDKVTGDKVVIDIAEAFLEKLKVDYETFSQVWQFAIQWNNLSHTNGEDIPYDVRGLYGLGANFAFNNLTKFLQSEIRQKGEGEVLDTLEKYDLNLEDIISELNKRNIPFEVTQSNTGKAITRLAQGQVSYVANKVVGKINGSSEVVDTTNVYITGLSKVAESWATKKGVSVEKIIENGKEKARLIKISQETAFVDLMMDRSGMVDMQHVEKELRDSLVFAAPLAFTTGDHKMTEIAMKDGYAMNHLISTEGKDGLVIASKEGGVLVLNKKHLMLSDFNISGLADQGDRELRITESLSDYKEFLDIMRTNKLSLLSNMLLISDGTPYLLKREDGNDSRRLFVTFNDGSVGILDSSEEMSTNDMIKIAATLGVKNAVYMDTGMYDMATYYEPNGKDHILGHVDTDKSTNRLVIFARQ